MAISDETDEQRDARLRKQLMLDVFKEADKDPGNGKVGEPYGSLFDHDKGMPS